jgi:hypothetical protein
MNKNWQDAPALTRSGKSIPGQTVSAEKPRQSAVPFSIPYWGARRSVLFIGRRFSKIKRRSTRHLASCIGVEFSDSLVHD